MTSFPIHDSYRQTQLLIDWGAKRKVDVSDLISSYLEGFEDDLYFRRLLPIYHRQHGEFVGLRLRTNAYIPVVGDYLLGFCPTLDRLIAQSFFERDELCLFSNRLKIGQDRGTCVFEVDASLGYEQLSLAFNNRRIGDIIDV